MSEKFRNPQNDHIEDISSLAWLWTLLFGALYLAVKGVWSHFVVGIFLAILTMGLSWLIYPFFAKRILRHHYLKQGYQIVSGESHEIGLHS